MSDDWRLWLTAAGLPTDLSKQPGVTFDLIFMTVQAAIDGLGVAMGRTSYVEADIAKGRLVVPFEITLPADAGFYLVSPEAKSGSAEAAGVSAMADRLGAEQTLRDIPLRETHATSSHARRRRFDFHANNDNKSAWSI